MPIFLIRHGHAGHRGDWSGKDFDRPLTDKGESQAKAIAAVLGQERITRVISSPFVRCIQTVEPLAADLGLAVETDAELAEGHGVAGIRRLIDEAKGRSIALCSHGDVIPEALDWFARHGADIPAGFGAQKGSIWTLDVVEGSVVEGNYSPPPGP